jgi:hypothetical protein
MQRYTVYLYLESALYISGGTSTHHQERIHLYLQHLVFVTPLLLSAAIVDCCEKYYPLECDAVESVINDQTFRSILLLFR